MLLTGVMGALMAFSPPFWHWETGEFRGERSERTPTRMIPKTQHCSKGTRRLGLGRTLQVRPEVANDTSPPTLNTNVNEELLPDPLPSNSLPKRVGRGPASHDLNSSPVRLEDQTATPFDNNHHLSSGPLTDTGSVWVLSGR